MALELFNEGYFQFVGSVKMKGSWTGGAEGFSYRFQWGYGSYTNVTSYVNSDLDSGTYDRTPTVNKDRTIKFRPQSGGGTLGPGSGDFKTFADVAIFTAGLTPGVPTTTTCPVSGQVNPKTTESVGSVSMEVRVQGTSTWFANGGEIASGISGNVGMGVSGTLSGLTPGTTYEARFRIDRTTENSQIAYSAVGTFATQASASVVISPPLITSTEEMFVPAIILGAGSVVIAAPVMEEMGEMFVPDVIFSQDVVIEVFVQFNDIIERDAILG